MENEAGEAGALDGQGCEGQREETVMNQKRVAENLAAVEAHFHSEAANEVATALKLYTEDIVWEAPALNGLNRCYSGKEAVAENYRHLWASMRDVKFTFLQRFASEDRVVDDSLVTFEVIHDGYWHFSGRVADRNAIGSHLRDARRENLTRTGV